MQKMNTPNIQSEKFLEAMMLPDFQRREVLELLGEKIMTQLKVDKPQPKPQDSTSK
jgi:hypothetical protein